MRLCVYFYCNMEPELRELVRELVYRAFQDYAARFAEQVPPKVACSEIGRAAIRVSAFGNAMSECAHDGVIALEKAMPLADGRNMFHQAFTDALDGVMGIPEHIRAMGKAMQNVCSREAGMYVRPAEHGRIMKTPRASRSGKRNTTSRRSGRRASAARDRKRGGGGRQ